MHTHGLKGGFVAGKVKGGQSFGAERVKLGKHGGQRKGRSMEENGRTATRGNKGITFAQKKKPGASIGRNISIVMTIIEIIET